MWMIYLVLATLLSLFVAPIFLATFPMMLVTFVYFAYVRYDEDGNFLGA
jgi:hypothetical protein